MLPTQIIPDENLIKLGQIYYILKTDFILDFDNRLKCIKSIVNSGFDINYKLPLQSSVCQYKPEYVGNTVLHFAFELLFLDDFFIDFFIEKGADLTIKNNNGYTPLLLAFNKNTERKYSQIDISSLLLITYLKKKMFINIYSENGVSHFHVVCTTNLVEVVDSFLKAGCSVDERVNNDSSNYPGYTPLHFAAEYGQLQTMRLLLNNGANINSKDIKGMTPLHLLIKKNKKLIISIELFSTISDLIMLPDSLGLTCLHLSCFSDNTSLIDTFLNKDVDVDCAIKFDSSIWSGCTALHIASKCNRLPIIIHLLKKGANLLAKDANGTTPLDLCTKQYKLNEIIQIILTEKRHQLSQIKLTDGTCLLDVLHALRDSEEFKKFIKEKVLNINTCIPLSSPIWPGYNLFHLQAKFCNWMYLTTLLSYNVDLTMLNTDGMSILHLAFRMNKVEMVTSILNCYEKLTANSIDKDNLSHLHIACAVGHDTAIKYFLSKGSNPNLPLLNNINGVYGLTLNPSVIKAGSTPLHTAIKLLNFDLVNLLLSFGANPNAVDVDNVTPFQTILEFYDNSYQWLKPKVKVMLYCILNSDIKIQITRAISLIILRGNLLTLKTTAFIKNFILGFLEEKEYEKLGLTKLHVACAIDDWFMVKEELESGADVNKCINTDSDIWPGYTALHIVFEKNLWNTLKIAKLLLDHGADPTLKNASSLTPIHLSRYKKLEIGILLLKNKFTNINPANKEGLTHFHLCCMTSNVLVVEEFLQSGIDINAAVDHFAEHDAGYTPLHFAVKYGSREIIDLLISHGADLYIKDPFGLTPFHLIIPLEKFNLDRVKDLLRCPAIDFQTESRIGETIFERIFQTFIDSKYTLYSKTQLLDDLTTNLISNNRIRIDFARFTADKLYGSKLIANTACYLSPETFKQLINNIPDITDTDDKGLNALHHILNVNTLSESWDSDDELETNLIMNNYHDNIKVLVTTACEINHKDNEGKTILHRILIEDKRFNETAKVLLSLGADIRIKDDNGKTPYNYLNEDTFSHLEFIRNAFENHIAYGLCINQSIKIDDRVLTESEINGLIKEKSQFDDKLKQEVNLSISADYFFSEKFVIDFKRMPIVQRQAIHDVCNNDDLYLLFPRMYDFINLQFRKALARIRLLEPAMVSIRSLINLALPHVCSDIIFDNLSNNDLMNLVRAENGKLVFAPLPEHW